MIIVRYIFTHTHIPTIVPMPTLSLDINTPITLVKNSGALPPAAINVAPATSSDIANFSVITPTTLQYHNVA
jgi:hypothetical protein